MTVKTLSSAAPIVGPGGKPSPYLLGWLSSLVETLNAIQQKASVAAPAALNIVPTGGLQRGGSLNDDVGISFYRVMVVVADLPVKGNSTGDWAYALNGRKPGESEGMGTGVPVFWSVSTWFSATSGYQVTT